jgi:hypothetical protein
VRKKYELLPPKIAESDTQSLEHGMCGSGDFHPFLMRFVDVFQRAYLEGMKKLIERQKEFSSKYHLDATMLADTLWTTFSKPILKP